jgi:hypothetical protein
VVDQHFRGDIQQIVTSVPIGPARILPSDSFRYHPQYSACGSSFIALMMEAVCTSEMSVYFNKTTQHYIPEGIIFNEDSLEIY